MATAFPDWLKKKLTCHGNVVPTMDLINHLGLKTVCASAACPNQEECFARGTATFLILGDICTRKCRFCAVKKGITSHPDPLEPEKVAVAIDRLGISHAVVTSVTRDDLPDGGAAQFADTINAIRGRCPGAAVEVLAPDFRGMNRPVDLVASALPDVFGHNLETVPRLYCEIRPGAGYRRSLAVLERVKVKQPRIITKSGLMVGLGEAFTEVLQVFNDLRSVGCDIVTVGQYLQPDPQNVEVKEFVHPDTFEEYRRAALGMGFKNAMCGPFVRSSYRAGDCFKERA